jgi:hypothetical protein
MTEQDKQRFQELLKKAVSGSVILPNSNIPHREAGGVHPMRRSTDKPTSTPTAPETRRG